MMQDSVRDNVIADIWQRRKAWAAASKKFQSETRLARQAQLGLIIAGSVFATAAATEMLWLGSLFEASTNTATGVKQISAGLGAASLAAVGIVQQYFLSLKRSERWPRCRSVAESLKSEVFKFRAQAKPYDIQPSDGEDRALRLLNQVVAEQEGKAADLLVHVHPKSAGAKGAPGPLDPEHYIKQRLDDQIDIYYLPSAQKNLKSANIARNVIIILAVLGALISVCMSAGLLLGIGAWVAVLTTISAAIATFASLNRFDFLASAYAKQAYSLSQLRRQWKADNGGDWSEFVTKCEETISAENRAWMAEMLQERETLQAVLPDDKKGSPS